MRNSWGGRRQRKYNNQKIHYDGHTFDSEVEYNRYLLLQDRVRDGEICDLKLKPAFVLEVAGVKIFERPFHPDFAYRLVDCPSTVEPEGARRGLFCVVESDSFPNKLWQPGRELTAFEFCQHCCIVEDTKGYMDPGDAATKIFNIQCRLMEAIYGIEIKVVQTILAKRRQEAAKKNKAEKRRLQKLALRNADNRQQRRLI